MKTQEQLDNQLKTFELSLTMLVDQYEEAQEQRMEEFNRKIDEALASLRAELQE